MIKNIIFDCGGVLTNCVPFEYVYSLNISNDEKNLLFKRIFTSKVWEKSDLGLFNSNEEMIKAFKDENKDILPLIDIFFQDDWMKFYYPYKDGQQLLKYFKNKGFNIYILSNYAKEGFQYCYENNDCFKLVDGIVVSADVKMIKPNIEIYKYLLNKYHLNKEECIFIDDRIKNVEASYQVGIKAIQYLHNNDEIISFVNKHNR